MARALFERAAKRGVTIFSSPSTRRGGPARGPGAPAYKIASFEAVDLPLIRYAAAKGKPLIISTGMANLARSRPPGTRRSRPGAGRGAAALRLQLPGHLRRRQRAHGRRHGGAFDCPIGLSDHTPGTAASVAAVAHGRVASIEKHFTLARADGGPDAAFSLEPAEFKRAGGRHQGRLGGAGPGALRRAGSERGSLLFRRSLYVTADVKAARR
jgi:N-acetylneuraminate synthase